MDRQPELMTLERLERRRGETWQGLWLAPLLTLVGQGFLMVVLADEGVGWLARIAVLVAAVAANLAAIWSVLRAHAREVQYSEAIDAELAATALSDYADVRAAALARPRRRVHSTEPPPHPTTVAATAAKAEAGTEEKGKDEDAGGEGETAVLKPDPDLDPAATPPAGAEPRAEREGWVARWDRHLTWWAAGETHAKSYMAWIATLGLFALADVAVYLATV